MKFSLPDFQKNQCILCETFFEILKHYGFVKSKHEIEAMENSQKSLSISQRWNWNYRKFPAYSPLGWLPRQNHNEWKVFMHE